MASHSFAGASQPSEKDKKNERINNGHACAVNLGLIYNAYIDWLRCDLFKPYIQKLQAVRKACLKHGGTGPTDISILKWHTSYALTGDPRISPGIEPFEEFDLIDYHVWFLSNVLRMNSSNAGIFFNSVKTQHERRVAILAVMRRMFKLLKGSSNRETIAAGLADIPTNALGTQQKHQVVTNHKKGVEMRAKSKYDRAYQKWRGEVRKERREAIMASVPSSVPFYKHMRLVQNFNRMADWPELKDKSLKEQLHIMNMKVTTVTGFLKTLAEDTVKELEKAIDDEYDIQMGWKNPETGESYSAR